MTGTLCGELCTFMIISRLFLVTTTICQAKFVEKTKTQNLRSTFFPKSYNLCHNVGKYGKVRRISSITKILINFPQIKFHG